MIAYIKEVLAVGNWNSPGLKNYRQKSGSILTWFYMATPPQKNSKDEDWLKITNRIKIRIAFDIDYTHGFSKPGYKIFYLFFDRR